MNAPTYTADDFAEAFGGNYGAPPGTSVGLVIPLNALHSCAEELNVLSLAANEDQRPGLGQVRMVGQRVDQVGEIHLGVVLSARRHLPLACVTRRVGGATAAPYCNWTS